MLDLPKLMLKLNILDVHLSFRYFYILNYVSQILSEAVAAKEHNEEHDDHT